MRQTFKRLSICIALMATTITFTFIGCKKNGSVAKEASLDKLNDYEKDIKAQIAVLPYWEKLPTKITNHSIAAKTFLADKNNKPLNQSESANTPAAPCNFTTPAYCNMAQYARAYDCSVSTPGSDGVYYIDFSYELSWDNAPVTKGSKGYLKIYNTQTNALVVDEITNNLSVTIKDRGADPFNSGNNIYWVNFRIPNAIARQYLENTTGLYSLYTAALFATSCTNGTNYLVGSTPITSNGFTGASANDPCTRNDKVLCLIASSGQPNPTYAPSIYLAGVNACTYNSTFIKPDVIQGEYSLNGGLTWFSNFTGGCNNGSGFAKLNQLGLGGFMSAPSLASGTFDLIFRYRNWKYGDPVRNTIACNPYFTIPSLTASPADCTNQGNPSILNSGYTYYYYGTVTIP